MDSRFNSFIFFFFHSLKTEQIMVSERNSNFYSKRRGKRKGGSTRIEFRSKLNLVMKRDLLFGSFPPLTLYTLTAPSLIWWKKERKQKENHILLCYRFVRGGREKRISDKKAPLEIFHCLALWFVISLPILQFSISLFPFFSFLTAQFPLEKDYWSTLNIYWCLWWSQ